MSEYHDDTYNELVDLLTNLIEEEDYAVHWFYTEYVYQELIDQRPDLFTEANLTMVMYHWQDQDVVAAAACFLGVVAAGQGMYGGDVERWKHMRRVTLDALNDDVAEMVDWAMECMDPETYYFERFWIDLATYVDVELLQGALQLPLF